MPIITQMGLAAQLAARVHRTPEEYDQMLTQVQSTHGYTKCAGLARTILYVHVHHDKLWYLVKHGLQV
jgi:hypothetical protein